MDIATASTTTSVKTPEKVGSEAPARIQSVKPLSFSNGVLKRHQSLHHHHLLPPVIVTYKECLKNHAAAMGGHAVDGCGEFMPSPASTPSDPTSLKCAACGCHRNFHRREPDDPPAAATQHVVEYQPHHRHHPPPPLPAPPRSPNSASPPPISSSYYPSAPHVLLALSSGGLSGQPLEGNSPVGVGGSGGNPNPSSRKRFRTKFTQTQKERMHEFAEKLTWKMQKRDDDVINRFCDEIGVERGVFKVWMHNNKNTLAKKDPAIPLHPHNNEGEISDRINLESSDDQLNLAPAAHYHQHHLHRHHNNSDEVSAHPVATNGSSSSS